MNKEFVANFDKQIDRVDKEILFLIKRRFQLEKKVAKYKFDNNIPLEDLTREDEILNNVIAQAKLMELSESFVRRLFETILNESKTLNESFINERKGKQK